MGKEINAQSVTSNWELNLLEQIHTATTVISLTVLDVAVENQE